MGEDYIRRTAVVRINVSDEQRTLLEETVSAWKRGCQLATDMAWGVCRDKWHVQSLAYEAVREQTSLGSQHSVLATHQAAQAITGCVERKARGMKTSKPRFVAPTVKYDTRTMTLFDDETVSLTTTENRVRCSLVLPDDEAGYQRRYLDSKEWEETESTLTIDRNDTVLLHIGFRRPKTAAERDTAEDGTVLGVDLGVENIAVTSTARFFPGRELTHVLREFETVRGALQRTGTRSAHRTLQNASRRQLRYVRQEMHRVSNGIIEEARRYGVDIIVLEDLTGIRDRTSGPWGHRWAYRRLREQIRYKSEIVGISVREVDPAYTSKRCSKCDFTADENRPTRTDFKCCRCGMNANADYNAAKNIGLRYVRRGLSSSRRTGDSRLALKSGTVTPNGGYTAYPNGFEAEFMDKSSSRQATRER